MKCDDQLKELMLATQSGNKEAYSSLLTNLERMITHFCNEHSFGTDLTDKAVSDVLQSVHLMLTTYSPERSFCSWFDAIAKSKLEYYLAVKRRELRVKESSFCQLVDSGEVGMLGDNLRIDN